MESSDAPAQSVRELNRGCYDSPHSGVGMEFDPLELASLGRRLVLHECGYLRDLDWWMFPNTVSPFWRLYYNSVAGHQVVFPGRTVPLNPDRIVLIPEGNSFDSQGDKPVNHFWLTFSLCFAVRQPGPIVLPADRETIAEIARIAAVFDGIGRGDRLLAYHASQALLHRLVVAIRGELWPGERSLALARAVHEMRRHFAEPIHIAEIAAHAGLSQRTLSDHFQREYHCSPGQFLNRLRIGEAAGMLVRTSASLETIAQATGFADRFYLSRVFKRTTGKTPASYRKQHTRPPGEG
jgi:AraC family transcriptional regulator, arabinose operon regulatory protein